MGEEERRIHRKVARPAASTFVGRAQAIREHGARTSARRRQSVPWSSERPRLQLRARASQRSWSANPKPRVVFESDAGVTNAVGYEGARYSSTRGSQSSPGIALRLRSGASVITNVPWSKSSFIWCCPPFGRRVPRLRKNGAPDACPVPKKVSAVLRLSKLLYARWRSANLGRKTEV